MGNDIPTKPSKTPNHLEHYLNNNKRFCFLPRSSKGADLCEVDSGYSVNDIPVLFFFSLRSLPAVLCRI